MTGPLASRPIDLPELPRTDETRGPFIIRAVVSQSTSTKRQLNAKTHFSTSVTVPVIVGTEFIIPTLRGWALGYGTTDPWDLSKRPDPIGAPGWSKTDHHLGLASVDVWVERINPPDHTTEVSTQTAVIRVTAVLGDHNLDDNWWAWVTYNLICLARHP